MAPLILKWPNLFISSEATGPMYCVPFPVPAYIELSSVYTNIVTRAAPLMNLPVWTVLASVHQAFSPDLSPGVNFWPHSSLWWNWDEIPPK